MPECRAAAVLTCLFWLSLVQARQHDTLTRLKQDVEKLNELGYVQVIEGPTPVPVVAANVSGIVALYPTEDDGINGPWQIDINIRGASPWLGPFRARLTCNEFYPKHLCSVAFRSSVAHPRLSQGHGSAPDRKFYSSISDKTVVGVVVALHALLTQNLQLKHNSDAYYTAQQAKQRAATISKYSTMRKTPALFNDTVPWPREWFAPGVLDAIAEGGDALRAILRQEVPGVYSFPLFRKEFAEIFLAELDNFYKSGLPIRRPNSMNNYGLIVNEIGMEAAIFQLQAEVLQPVARLLFPEEGSSLDTHHSFIVEYRPDKDLGLDMHTDDSDVTFNVCLGRNFTGAGLKFCGKMGHPDHRLFQTSYQHEVGRCVVHLGAQRHGADDIRTGQRNNLIIWNHNLAFRNIGGHRKHGFHVEERAPDLDCLSYTHDRDYAVFKEFPKGREEMGKRPGWCPPNEKCYDSMLPAWQLTALRQAESQKSGAPKNKPKQDL